MRLKQMFDVVSHNTVPYISRTAVNILFSSATHSENTMEVSRFLTIHYVDGMSETFIFPKQATDHFDLMKKLNKTMTVDRLVIEADGSLHIIPLSAVKRFEFSPVPETLPEGIIRGATLSS
jgi:hypothetical protein